jgi:hypothetical protein
MGNPANPFVQEFYGQTTLHPLGLVAVLAMGTLMLIVRRRHATLPMIVIACFVSSAQRVVIAGADFTMLRLLVLVGAVRILARNECRGLRWNRLDTVVVAWALTGAVLPVFRVGPSILMNRAGYLYDAVGLYFLFRVLIRDWDDVRAAVRSLMWCSVPAAGFILLEWQTGHNVFSIFGGVPEITSVRDGRIRCQGAFEHPILAGAFFATLLPLAAAYGWQHRHSRLLALASCSACLVIVVASSSATPITAVAAAGVGAAAFPLRYRMRWIFWGIVLAAVGLHLLMFAPVWHLITRLSIVAGNSSWHRFALIDGAIQHLDEWWLIGSDMGTAHWGHFTFDVTNYYIILGQDGGLLLLALFLLVIATAFREVGRTWRRFVGDRPVLMLAWGLGVALWVHVVNFIGISYFGQIWVAWYLLLGMIGSTVSCRPVALRLPENRFVHRPVIVRHPMPEPGDEIAPSLSV